MTNITAIMLFETIKSFFINDAIKILSLRCSIIHSMFMVLILSVHEIPFQGFAMELVPGPLYNCLFYAKLRGQRNAVSVLESIS